MRVGGGYKFHKVCREALIQVIYTDVPLLHGRHMLNNDNVKHNRYLKVLNTRDISDNPLILSV